MDHAARRRRHIPEGVHMRHHVVAEPALVFGDGRKVDVVEVRAHLGDRLLGDRDPELALRFGEREPEPTPEPMAGLRTEERQHRLRGIALGERGAIGVVTHRMRKSVE